MITLHPDEKILLAQRVFWLPISLQSAGILIIALIPFLAIFVFRETLPADMQTLAGAYELPALFFATAWALVFWIILSMRWTDYYLDVVLVTTKRIIDIEQRGLFSRDTAETRLENIQDMRVEIAGFVASVMNFGNLYIQTAASTNQIVIKNIGNPNAVKDVIAHECERMASANTSH